MPLHGYTLTKLAGTYALSRLDPRGQDKVIAHAPIADTTALRGIALILLKDLGWYASSEEADLFVSSFFSALQADRFGVRTLPSSIVEDWIARGRKGRAA